MQGIIQLTTYEKFSEKLTFFFGKFCVRTTWVMSQAVQYNTYVSEGQPQTQTWIHLSQKVGELHVAIVKSSFKFFDMFVAMLYLLEW